jgi:acyl-CoA synthetase (AMP-forming)/AMP-acid ligase II
MSLPNLLDQVAAVADVLTELDVRRNERVLIMLPDGPGFAESCAGTLHHDAVPLPVSPRLTAHDLAATAGQASARRLLASPDQLPTLTELDTEPPILVNGPHGPWVAVLRLR